MYVRHTTRYLHWETRELPSWLLYFPPMLLQIQTDMPCTEIKWNVGMFRAQQKYCGLLEQLWLQTCVLLKIHYHKCFRLHISDLRRVVTSHCNHNCNCYATWALSQGKLNSYWIMLGHNARQIYPKIRLVLLQAKPNAKYFRDIMFAQVVGKISTGFNVHRKVTCCRFLSTSRQIKGNIQLKVKVADPILLKPSLA